MIPPRTAVCGVGFCATPKTAFDTGFSGALRLKKVSPPLFFIQSVG